jgi:hypothetical protein
VALDNGITEWEFWDMTPAEIKRAIESKQRQKEQAQQEKASFDYILADLIGRSVARVYSSQNRYPEISSVYPTLFKSAEIQEQKQQAKMQASAERFRQFAQAYNNNYKKEASSK